MSCLEANEECSPDILIQFHPVTYCKDEMFAKCTGFTGSLNFTELKLKKRVSPLIATGKAVGFYNYLSCKLIVNLLYVTFQITIIQLKLNLYKTFIS